MRRLAQLLLLLNMTHHILFGVDGTFLFAHAARYHPEEQMSIARDAIAGTVLALGI
jgi:hypothetical protein